MGSGVLVREGDGWSLVFSTGGRVVPMLSCDFRVEDLPRSMVDRDGIRLDPSGPVKLIRGKMKGFAGGVVRGDVGVLSGKYGLEEGFEMCCPVTVLSTENAHKRLYIEFSNHPEDLEKAGLLPAKAKQEAVSPEAGHKRRRQ